MNQDNKQLTDNCPMPFGQYKGKAMANVPDSYLRWLHAEGSDTTRMHFPEVFEYIKENADVLQIS